MRQILSLTLALLATSIPLFADGALKVADGQKIAFLGDSITQFGWERPGGYVRLVVAGLASVGVKVTAIPAGISGNTSRDMLARLDKSVLNQKPDWMTLSCGVNDVWHNPGGVDLETYKKNITSIVDQAAAAGIKVMILTATPIMETDNAMNQQLAGYNDFLRQLAKERKFPLVDLNAACWAALKANPPAPGTNLYTVDGVHMNPLGNMIMARGILEGFGVSSAQVNAYEATWRKSDDAAAITASLQMKTPAGDLSFGATVGVSIATFDNFNAVAQERKIRTIELANELYFKAIREVMKAHEQDPAFTPKQLLTEAQTAFGQLVKSLPIAATTQPAAK